ncbi:DNA-binding protein, partial [Promicromonospora kroppenstedtii]|uniref:DNA-binding protein n=1 Tax=Promicromonospora kroppenstedtii TaxID=440482 RepID=UPI00056B6D09
MRDKERVFQAADALVAEGAAVTVTNVRERAGCSNATATKYLREWRETRAAESDARSALPELPSSVSALAERGIEALWGAAVEAARTEHEAA